MEARITPMNGHIFVRHIKETKKVGGLDLIGKIDDEDRYSKAEVVYAEEHGPLSIGSIVLFDKNNGHDFQDEDEMLRVLHLGNIVGVL